MRINWVIPGAPSLCFAFLCFQWYAMRVCRMVMFITLPLFGHLFNAGLQMSGSIPAFTGKGCRLLISTGQTCRHSCTFTWFICGNQPTQKAYKHMISQTYVCGGQFLYIHTIISHTVVCLMRIRVKHWRSPVCAHTHTNTQFANRLKTCLLQ